MASSNEISVNIVDCKYEIVKEVFKKKQYKIVQKPTDECHIYWNDTSTRGWADAENRWRLKRWQRINHFPGMVNLARKSRLAQNLDRMRRQFLTKYSFYPRTWVLPLECSDFRTQFDSKGISSKVFIIKPDSGCQVWIMSVSVTWTCRREGVSILHKVSKISIP